MTTALARAKDLLTEFDQKVTRLRVPDGVDISLRAGWSGSTSLQRVREFLDQYDKRQKELLDIKARVDVDIETLDKLGAYMDEDIQIPPIDQRKIKDTLEALCAAINYRPVLLKKILQEPQLRKYFNDTLYEGKADEPSQESVILATQLSEDELNKAQTEIEKLNAQLGELTKAKQATEFESRKTTTELEQARSMLAKSKGQIDQLEKDNAVLTAQMQELQTKLETAEADRTTEEALASTKRKVLEQLNVKLAAHAKERSEALASAQSDLKQAQSEAKIAQSDLKTLERSTRHQVKSVVDLLMSIVPGLNALVLEHFVRSPGKLRLQRFGAPMRDSQWLTSIPDYRGQHLHRSSPGGIPKSLST